MILAIRTQTKTTSFSFKILRRGGQHFAILSIGMDGGNT